MVRDSASVKDIIITSIIVLNPSEYILYKLEEKTIDQVCNAN